AVASVTPLYVRTVATWKVPGSGELRPIRVFGFDCRTQALHVSPLAGQAPLASPGAVLFDSASRVVYGRPAAGTIAAVGGRNVRVAGFFSMGVDLGTDGNLIMDEGTYFSIFGAPRGDADTDAVDYGLIRLRPGCDPEAALAEVRRRLDGDVRVFAREEY